MPALLCVADLPTHHAPQLRGCVKPFAALAEAARASLGQRTASRLSSGDLVAYRSGVMRQARPVPYSLAQTACQLLHVQR